MGTPSAVDLPVARRIRRAVSLPIFHAGTIDDPATARHALREGAVDMVGMTRAASRNLHAALHDAARVMQGPGQGAPT